MGYTHYWRVNNLGDQEKWSAAMTDIVKIVKYAGEQNVVPLGDTMGDGVPELKDGELIALNGRGTYDSHETFFLKWQLTDYVQRVYARDDGPWVFEFCKTAQKPYDVVVTACLVRLAEVGEENVWVTSDGEPLDWAKGRLLATVALGRELLIPSTLGQEFPHERSVVKS